MIELKGLCKSFEEKEVLTDINATFENGKTNLIIGQSGSGKTVLMKCIVGLLTPEKGELLYDHRNFLTMGKKEKKALRREMGMIFQSAALFDSFLHTATDFTGEFIFRFNKVYALQAKHGTSRAVAQGIRAEHVEGEHNIEWEGSKNDIFTSTNERLNNFIFASDLFRKVKEVEIQNIEG